MKQSPPSDRVAQAKFKRRIESNQRACAGSGFWLISNRPFDEAATDLFCAAIKANKPTPSVLGNNRHKTT